MKTIKAPILRYYVDPDHRDEFLDELILTCKANGIRDAMLFDISLIDPEQLLTLPRLVERCEHLTICARRLRDEGIAFHLNVTHTLGQVLIPQETLEHFGFQRQLRADGSNGSHPVLDPSCPKLRAYLVEAFRIYGTLHADRVFLDDDFGMRMDQCFLPDRVRRFAGLFGCENDSMTVKRLFDAGDRKALATMQDLITGDLCELAVLLRDALHELSPDTRIGLMHPHIVCYDVAKVARAFAGPHRPFVRPQIPLYREDCRLSEYAERFGCLDRWQAALPADFELFPEAENYPYDPAIKSPAAALAHYTYILASGEPAPALSLNSLVSRVPASESRSIVDRFVAHHRQTAELVRLMQQGAVSLGGAFWGEPEALINAARRRPNFSILSTRGIPLRCVSNPLDATLLWGEGLSDCDDESLQSILERGGFLDLRALSFIEKRGLLSKIGLTIKGRSKAEEVATICYPRLDHGDEFWNFYYFISRLPGHEHLPLRVQADNSEVLLSYFDSRHRKSVPHLLRWTAPNGTRFALLNAMTEVAVDPISSYWAALRNLWSTRYIAETIEWLQGTPLPARVLSDGTFLLKVVRTNSSGQIVLSCWNLGSDSAPRVEIAIAGDLLNHQWGLLDAEGALHPVAAESRAGQSRLVITEPVPTLGGRFLISSKELGN